MRLGTMTAIVGLLVSVTGNTEGSSASDLQQAGLSRPLSRMEPRHKIRHRHSAARPRRQGQHRRHRLPAEPLPLPADLQGSSEDAELEDFPRRYADPDFTVCCPTVEEVTRPLAGTRLDGSLGILHFDAGFNQTFFERSCRAQTDEEKALVRRHLRHRFRCVQEYSHSYALLVDVDGSKVLDYIRIRSGCRCEIKQRSSRRKKKRKRDRRKRAEMRRREKRKRFAQRGGQSQMNFRDAP